jgi:hypothetical protein
MHDHAEEAEKFLIALTRRLMTHTINLLRELFVIKSELDQESQSHLLFWQVLKKRTLQKHFLIGFLSMDCTECSGLLVVLSRSN